MSTPRQRSRTEAARRVRVKSRVLRVAKQLENFLGVPRQTHPLPPPLDMLIATILSQNTNDKNSYRAYTELRKRFTGWDEVARAPLHRLKAAIVSGGMANQKAARIKEILATIKQRYGAYDLSSLAHKSNEAVIEELVRFNGVGLKTASCVLLFSLGRDVFPVDTHVHRICNRLGFVNDSRTPEATFEMMKPLIPKGRGYSFHTNLIRFGRMVCRSSQPRCHLCPLFDKCRYEGKSARRKQTAPTASGAEHSFMLLDNVR
ncbi:MAG: endonuclease III [Ignavibacteria bacterium]